MPSTARRSSTRATGSWPARPGRPHLPDSAGRRARVFDDWQFNVIAAHNSGTPFTVSDSANVSLQANSPPISGFAASRPNVVGDPERRAAHGRPVAQPRCVPAAQHPDPRRTVRQRRAEHRARTRLHQRRRLARAQLRAARRRAPAVPRRGLQRANHANFGLPVADLNSANFGRIFSAGPARLLQFALKLMF